MICLCRTLRLRGHEVERRAGLEPLDLALVERVRELNLLHRTSALHSDQRAQKDNAPP
jgi:hypothetical protein